MRAQAEYLAKKKTKLFKIKSESVLYLFFNKIFIAP